MSKRTSSKIASANDSHPPPPQRQTGFTTADKLTDFDHTFNSKEVKKEVKKHPATPRTPPTTQPTRESPPPTSPKTKKKPRNTSKRSKNHPAPENLYLTIIDLLKNGLRPSKICSELSVTKQSLQYHLNILKDQGAIQKVGYGVWEVIDNPEIVKKRSKKTLHVTKEHAPSKIQQNLHMFVPDSIRLHGIMLKFDVPPNLRNWTNEKREKYLDRKNIPYKQLGIIGGGQRLIIDGRKTHLTNQSIIFYDTGSYFAENAFEAKSTAIHSFLSSIKKLERILKVDLTIKNNYRFKVSRQHAALVKNAIAEQYDREGNKLEIRSEGNNSLWALIDNSFGVLHEFEAVHPDTATEDADFLQTFFNDARTTGVTPSSILNITNRVQNNQLAIQQSQASYVELHNTYAKNTASHLELITNINAAVQDLTAAVYELTKAAKNGGGDP